MAHPIDESWSRIEAWLGKAHPELLEDLKPGASETEIAAIEKHIGRSLPDAVRASYRIHDGQHGEVTGVLYGLPLLGLSAAASEWDVWNQLTYDEELDDGQVSVGFVKQVYWCDGWFPLSQDGGGNHLGIDLDPPEGGTRGQVINFGRDEYMKFILAPTWEEFLAQLADDLEAGRAAIRDGELSFRGVGHYLDRWSHSEVAHSARDWHTKMVRVDRALKADHIVEAIGYLKDAMDLARKTFEPTHFNFISTAELYATTSARLS